ncbi:MAG: MTH1187 family thiamine-binding protein [bacterium]|nr:MAG: MTH1187 family thiamine-binding protein [bacterium]
MAIAEISVVPIGTGDPSVSEYVAECIRALDKADIKHTLTPMGTVIEGSLDEILEAVRMLHRVPLNHGAARVLTKLVIDERRDKDASAEQKVASVRKRLAGS